MELKQEMYSTFTTKSTMLLIEPYGIETVNLRHYR